MTEAERERAAVDIGPLDIRGEVTRRRAKAILAADAKGIPRRPMSVIVRGFDEADQSRLRGAHRERDDGDVS